MGAMLLNSPEIEDIEWTVDLEVQLLFSMIGHKPVGKKLTYICIYQCVVSSVQVVSFMCCFAYCDTKV